VASLLFVIVVLSVVQTNISLALFFIQIVSCQSQEPVDQLQYSDVPFVWYETPTDETTRARNDCGLRNDYFDGPANAVNRNVTDGEDEDVLSSLLSTHSFTQNDASPYMLDYNGTGSEIVDVESVSRHLLGQICDVSNGRHLAHIGCGTINAENKALRVHESGVVGIENNVDISNCSQPVGAMNPYASHAHRQQFVGSNGPTDHYCSPTLHVRNRLSSCPVNEHNHTRPIDAVVCDRVNSILTRFGDRTDNNCIPTVIRTPHLQNGGLSMECDSASVHSDVEPNTSSSSFGTLAVNKYECTVCHQTFCNNSHLAKHRESHRIVKPYACDSCHKTYFHLHSLRLHKRLHSSTNAYICNVCTPPRAFTRQYDLDRHERRHSGVRPYICYICDRAYAYLHDLQQHQRFHCPATKSATKSVELNRRRRHNKDKVRQMTRL